MGAVVGSFLNVVIWRLPRGESVVSPGSRCPHCGRALSALDNVPLLSFLVLRAKCRTCKAPISWRYFVVELLTAALFLSFVLRFGPTATSAAYCLFGAALIAAFFIDLDHFLIPDSLNYVALFCGIGLDLLLMAQGVQGHALKYGFLPGSVIGAVVCAGVFVGIQVLGRLLFRKDAMGDGDVKLARAIGAMLPLSQALVSFLFAIVAGAVIGGANLLRHGRDDGAAEEEEPGEEEAPEQEGGLRVTLLYGAAYLAFVDVAVWAWEGARSMIRGRPAPALEEDDFQPTRTHIPFGPFMVAGFVAAVFFGERVVSWYLVWSGIDRLGK